jgi:drug/metabolite transporter (DMT)-like permease
MSRCLGFVSFVLFLASWLFAVYELDAPGIDGEVKNFEKPWAMTTVMFVAMTCCLPLAYLVEGKKKSGDLRGDQTLSEPLIDGNSTVHVNGEGSSGCGSTSREILMLTIPTFFDLVATILMNIGLLSVTASVYQMLRGAEMLFAAFFAVVFLKRKLNRYHFGGIGCCIVGITLVGVSSILAGEGSASHDVQPMKILLGMTLIVASQAVQAAQITFEDFFMADLNIPPLKIVGFEGLYGALAMGLILLPTVQRLPGVDGQGVHEDTVDTWHMILNNPTIARILLLDMVALLAYNVAGMCVTGHLGAVFRTVLETTRTLFVWLVDLILFYTPLGMGKLGESWSMFSWIQAAGFIVLVAGTVVYGKGDELVVTQEIERGLRQGQGEEGGVEEGGVDIALNGEAQRQSTEQRSIAAAIRQRQTLPIGVARSVGSYKSSMAINAFGSIPSSMPRSLRTIVGDH